MKFENNEFIPYKFPYGHNYRNYAQFVISNNVDFSKNDYYYYYDKQAYISPRWVEPAYAPTQIFIYNFSP